MSKSRLFLILILSWIALCGLGWYIYLWEYREPVLEARLFSLNKGRAIFIRTPDNKTLLVGGGQNSEVMRGLTSAMPFYRRTIDIVVVPSAVPAQIGGLAEVLQRYEVKEIMMPKLMATSTVLSQLMKEVRRQKIRVKEVERGNELEVEKDLMMKVLFPYEGFTYNKSSISELGTALEYKNTALYLVGNLSKTIQKDIAKGIPENDSENIIEFYHAAGESKVSPDLVEKLKPVFIYSTKEKAVTIVSDGSYWKGY